MLIFTICYLFFMDLFDHLKFGLAPPFLPLSLRLAPVNLPEFVLITTLGSLATVLPNQIMPLTCTSKTHLKASLVYALLVCLALLVTLQC